MAGLTLGTAFVSNGYKYKDKATWVRRFSGAGEDATTIAAAQTGKKLMVVGGRVSSSAAGSIAIKSGTNVIQTIEFVAAGTATFPGVDDPLECTVSELLALDPATGAGTCTGEIKWVVIDVS